MLYFVYQELALGYLALSFLTALGVLQWVAARYHLAGLGLLDYSEHRTSGYVLGIVLIAGSALWFFVTQWTRIFTPGPAGSELTLLFAAGAAFALIATLAVAALRRSHRAPPIPNDHLSRGTVVDVGRAPGHLFVPPEPTTPLPAVCLLPALTGSAQTAMYSLACHLMERKLVVLVIGPCEELASYPETLAVLPAALSFLSKRPEVDPQRLGALGYDLGGDLVIRAASADRQLRVLAALAPVLVDGPVALDLLREMSYPQAWRWSRDPKRFTLRTQLDALNHGARIAPRPLLLLYGTEDRLVARAPLENWATQDQTWVTHQIIQGAGHLNLLDHPLTTQTVAQWFGERL